MEKKYEELSSTIIRKFEIFDCHEVPYKYLILDQEALRKDVFRINLDSIGFEPSEMIPGVHVWKERE